MEDKAKLLVNIKDKTLELKQLAIYANEEHKNGNLSEEEYRKLYNKAQTLKDDLINLMKDAGLE